MDIKEKWTVLGCQLDLLDNRPLVMLEHKATGEAYTAVPGVVRELAVGRSDVYLVGYLEGAVDGLAGRVTALTLERRLAAVVSANDASSEMVQLQPELVPGG